MNTSETMFLLRAVTVRASIYMKALIQYVVLHTMIGYSDRGILQTLFSTVVILLVCVLLVRCYGLGLALDQQMSP